MKKFLKQNWQDSVISFVIAIDIILLFVLVIVTIYKQINPERKPALLIECNEAFLVPLSYKKTSEGYEVRINTCTNLNGKNYIQQVITSETLNEEVIKYIENVTVSTEEQAGNITNIRLIPSGIEKSTSMGIYKKLIK